jgi:drug/metabolite transporter (DMT)-like permease
MTQAVLNQNLRMSLKDWLMLVALAVIWGCSFFFIAVAVSELPPLTLAAMRVAFAAATLWCVVLAAGIAVPMSRQALWAFGVMGLINNAVPFTLIIWAQMHISSGLAAILIATTPLFGVVLAGLILTDERITTLRLSGVALGFAGVVLVIGTEALHGLGDEVLAIGACLTGACFFALASIFGRRFAVLGIDPLMAATAQVTASSCLLVPLALAVDQPWTLSMPGASTWAAVVALAVVSTAFGFILYFRVLAAAGATNVLLVNFLIPIPAIVLGVLLLGESMSSAHYAGLVLIGLGLSAVDGRLWRRR